LDTRTPVGLLDIRRTPTPAWKDEELVEECLRGNEQAWFSVVDKYKNLVYSAPMKYRMSPQDAADIFQEVWVDLHAELKNLRKPGALGGWLISVASHKCYQWKRRRLREAGQPAPGSDREPRSREMLFPEWKEESERSQLLRDTVAGLPERCQRMVHMLFFHEPPMPYAEVARQLGLAEGSIGFIRGKCLEKLRAALEKKGF
jgi:RNA polymerase sigma factor (sigma-70 family)